MTRDWSQVYQRPPAQLDAALFVVALLLHVPLFTIHMAAPKGGAKARVDRLLNIDYIEQQAIKRQEKKAVLPPKVDSVQDAVKKAAEIREKLLKKAVPPPPVTPKPKINEPEIKALDAAKIQMELKQRMAQNAPQLKTDKNFAEKPGQLPGATPAGKEIKVGGNASAIRMGAKPGDLAGAGAPGPVLQGKSAFTMTGKTAPVGIGGGDSIKMGAAPAVVVPVGKRAVADAGVLSAVAVAKDRGSMQSKGGGGTPGGTGIGGAGSGLVLGTGGGGTIAGAGRPSGPAAPLPVGPPLTSSGKSFSEKSGSSSSSSSVGSVSLGGGGTGEGLPKVGALARRQPRAAKPLFQITGPLANRPIVFQEQPQYPDWARAKAIEASVILQFTVSPEGVVKTNILILRTSGYPQMDQTAVDSLRKFRFVPLPDEQSGDMVGAITFLFSIR